MLLCTFSITIDDCQTQHDRFTSPVYAELPYSKHPRDESQPPVQTKLCLNVLNFAAQVTPMLFLHVYVLPGGRLDALSCLPWTSARLQDAGYIHTTHKTVLPNNADDSWVVTETSSPAKSSYPPFRNHPVSRAYKWL